MFLAKPSFRIALRSKRCTLVTDDIPGILRRLLPRLALRPFPLHSSHYAYPLTMIFLHRKPPACPHASYLTLLHALVYLMSDVWKTKRIPSTVILRSRS